MAAQVLEWRQRNKNTK